MKIVWTTLAVQDLHHAWKYIAQDNMEAADDMMERVAHAVEGLLAYPQLGRAGRVKGTRELVIVGTPFVIPYRLKPQRIEILAILHGARRWPTQL